MWHKQISLAGVYTDVTPIADLWIENDRHMRGGDIRRGIHLCFLHMVLLGRAVVQKIESVHCSILLWERRPALSSLFYILVGKASRLDQSRLEAAPTV